MTDVEGFPEEKVQTGKRLFVSPITGEPYIVTKWVQKGPGRFAAIEKEPVEDRLFVPLRTEHWTNFAVGQKDIELRGVNNNFNAKTVYSGRPAELRRGYSTDDSIWGIIASVWFFDSIEVVADELDHQRIVPDSSRREFVRGAEEMLGEYDRYVAFSVGVDDGS